MLNKFVDKFITWVSAIKLKQECVFAYKIRIK